MSTYDEGWRPFPGNRNPDAHLRWQLKVYTMNDEYLKKAPKTVKIIGNRVKNDTPTISQQEFDNLVAAFNDEKAESEAHIAYQKKFRRRLW
jgi:hypothetical protein